MMGKGKTAVISPLLIINLALKNNRIKMVLPKHLISDAKSESFLWANLIIPYSNIEFITDIDVKHKFLSEYPSITPSSDIVLPKTTYLESNSNRLAQEKKKEHGEVMMDIFTDVPDGKEYYLAEHSKPVYFKNFMNTIKNDWSLNIKRKKVDNKFGNIVDAVHTIGKYYKVNESMNGGSNQDVPENDDEKILKQINNSNIVYLFDEFDLMYDPTKSNFNKNIEKKISPPNILGIFESAWDVVVNNISYSGNLTKIQEELTLLNKFTGNMVRNIHYGMQISENISIDIKNVCNPKKVEKEKTLRVAVPYIREKTPVKKSFFSSILLTIFLTIKYFKENSYYLDDYDYIYLRKSAVLFENIFLSNLDKTNPLYNKIYNLLDTKKISNPVCIKKVKLIFNNVNSRKILHKYLICNFRSV